MLPVMCVQEAHLDKQMAFLILQSGRHEEGQDLVEQRAGAKIARLVSQLAQGALALRGRAVLHLEQQLHDLALLHLLHTQLLLIHLHFVPSVSMDQIEHVFPQERIVRLPG